MAITTDVSRYTAQLLECRVLAASSRDPVERAAYRAMAAEARRRLNGCRQQMFGFSVPRLEWRLGTTKTAAI